MINFDQRLTVSGKTRNPLDADLHVYAKLLINFENHVQAKLNMRSFQIVFVIFSRCVQKNKIVILEQIEKNFLMS